MVTGQNKISREDKITEFKGADVKLLSTVPSDGVDSLSLSNVKESSTTKTSDWNISHDNNSGTTVLSNTSEFTFSSVSNFILNAVVLQSTNNPDNMIIDDNPVGDIDLTKENKLVIPSGNIAYTFGGK